MFLFQLTVLASAFSLFFLFCFLNKYQSFYFSKKRRICCLIVYLIDFFKLVNNFLRCNQCIIFIRIYKNIKERKTRKKKNKNSPIYSPCILFATIQLHRVVPSLREHHLHMRYYLQKYTLKQYQYIEVNKALRKIVHAYLIVIVIIIFFPYVIGLHLSAFQMHI